MNTRSILSRLDYEEYLVRAYLNVQQGYLEGCVHRAYSDSNRGLRGLGRLLNREALQAQGIRAVVEALEDLCGTSAGSAGVAEFDQWHQALCTELVRLYREQAAGQLTLGHAQRWVNTALRNVYVVGETRLPGYGQIYLFCHAPLDGYLLDALAVYGMPPLPCAWYRLEDYTAYLECQRWIRRRFEFAPLDVEFLLGLGQDLRNLTLP